MIHNREAEAFVEEMTRHGQGLDEDIRAQLAESGHAAEHDFFGFSIDAPSEGQAKEQSQVADAKATLDAEKSGACAVSPWFNVPAEIVQAQMAEIRPFVDWAVEVYAFTTTEMLPCWWRHPELASEWMGLWHLYRLSFSVEDSGAGPQNFHYWLSVARVRTRAYVTALTCTMHEHREKATIRDLTVATNEEWEAVSGQSTYVPVSTWPRYEHVGGDESE